MRGHVHKLRLINPRIQSGVDAGKVVTDSEGRWLASPSNPPHNVGYTELEGFIGTPRRIEVTNGEEISTAAHLPRGTVVARGDELEAWDTGDANLDGRYKIIGVQPGKAMVRVLLQKHAT